MTIVCDVCKGLGHGPQPPKSSALDATGRHRYTARILPPQDVANRLHHGLSGNAST
jgi:hypothetical protein